MDHEFVLRFDEATANEADQLAGSLQQQLLELDSPVRVERQRTSDETQDFGATLIIILGSTAVTAVATGIKLWLARHNSAKLSVLTPEGKLVAKNLESKDVADIVRALREKH